MAGRPRNSCTLRAYVETLIESGGLVFNAIVKLFLNFPPFGSRQQLRESSSHPAPKPLPLFPRGSPSWRHQQEYDSHVRRKSAIRSGGQTTLGWTKRDETSRSSLFSNILNDSVNAGKEPAGTTGDGCLLRLFFHFSIQQHSNTGLLAVSPT
ncbi:Uncharacterized protein HZ326_27901 [Fusarium oxysporum f. sp. albedinis]|nr:Uncharacterized protein HZ326_27901 [Fusarium oxysporum f. sp. albedinis]